MMSLKLAGKGIASSLLIVLSIVTATLTTCGSKEPTHLSDETLEENLRQHEADFDSLIRMSKVDSKVIRIADDFTWLDTNANWPRPASEIGFSTERWGEYRHMFQVLGLKQGLLKPLDSDTIYLIASSKGMVTSGSSKGYAYSIKPLSPLSDSLNHIAPELQTQPTVYKKLGDNWYLFYQSN